FSDRATRPPMTAAPSSSVDSLVQAAVESHRAGDVAAAEVQYRRALAADPEHPEAHHNLGIILLQRGDADAGFAHVETALANDPSREHCWLSHARALLLGGRHADAVASLTGARAR